MSNDPHRYVPGETFHSQPRAVYAEPLGWAVNKRSEAMARVVYEAVHLNQAEEGDRRGHGRDFATWVFSEEPGLKEGLFQSAFELMIDARLEPGAAVGLHRHDHTEEIYYLLEGALRMTTLGEGGREATVDLRPGDAHLIRVGQSHFGVAGPEGARFIAVAMRPEGAAGG